jgi:hypothetical protein
VKWLPFRLHRENQAAKKKKFVRQTLWRGSALSEQRVDGGSVLQKIRDREQLFRDCS